MKHLLQRLIQDEQYSPLLLEALEATNVGDKSSTILLSSFAKPRIRVALWPIVSNDMPDIALGLTGLLALLLENWSGCRVLRLFVIDDEVEEDSLWDLTHSQFGPDEWFPENLDEDLVIWGRMSRPSGNLLSLVINVDSEADLDQSTRHITLSGMSVAELVLELVAQSTEIARSLNLPTMIYDFELDKLQLMHSGFEEFLKALGEWNVHMLLGLWGRGSSNQKLKDLSISLIDYAQRCVSGFVASLTIRSLSSVLYPRYKEISQVAVDAIPKMQQLVLRAPESSNDIAIGLYRIGLASAAFEYFEVYVNVNMPINWAIFSDLCLVERDYLSALNILQRAIGVKGEEFGVLRRYGNLMLLLASGGFRLVSDRERESVSGVRFHEQLVFLENHQQIGQESLILEAIEALKRAIMLSPNNIDTLSLLVTQMIIVQSTEMWKYFGMLIDRDLEGAGVRSVVDTFYMVDNPKVGIELLEQAVKRDPNRLNNHLNLVRAYIGAEDVNRAKDAVNQFRAIGISMASVDRGEIERLEQIVRDPEFEIRLGELTDQISAGVQVSSEDAEFLESVVEASPHFAQGYILLAAVYNNWGDTQDALDVLLDGQDLIPDNSNIVAALAQTLWENHQEDLALGYLNKGLSLHADSVPLLALAARYLFLRSMYDAAKALLLKAERLDPLHPVLRETRRLIARNVQIHTNDG